MEKKEKNPRRRRKKGVNLERILVSSITERKISNPVNFHRNRFNRKPIRRLIIPPSESRSQFTSHRLQLHRFFPKSICSLHRLIYHHSPSSLSPANNLSSCYLIDRFHSSFPKGEKRRGSNEKKEEKKEEEIT